MLARSQLIDFLDQHLQPQQFQDYCHNGLQLEGAAEVSHVVTGVTACQALLEQAVAVGAELVLVHHGLFWQSSPLTITGTTRARCALALANQLNVVAYHLPLDAHPEHGNNVCLAKVLGIDVEGELPWVFNQQNIGNLGHFAESLSVEALLTRMADKLGHVPLHIPGQADTIKRIAWCTGAAQRGLQTAIDCGVDAYVSGEISEDTVHLARESGCHYIAAGHHATEQFGVQALGELLVAQFGVQHTFINIPNPV